MKLNTRERFALAYARLLLSHLVDPLAALRAMRGSVSDGALVAVEDLFTGTLHSDPPTPALDRLQDVYSATVRFHGGDPTIGPRLPCQAGRPVGVLTRTDLLEYLAHNR